MKDKNVNLIYRGSRDGFGADKFHKKCDGFENTITVILSEHDKIFGGYTEVKWGTGKGHQSDSNAFIFSVSQKFISEVKDTEKAVWNKANSGPTFGDYDISISSCCNENSKSFSTFGYTYTMPEGMVYGSDEAESYLAGSNSFKVNDIEVF